MLSPFNNQFNVKQHDPSKALQVRHNITKTCHKTNKMFIHLIIHPISKKRDFDNFCGIIHRRSMLLDIYLLPYDSQKLWFAVKV